MKALDVVVSGICGALYAVVGYIIYLFLPITTPGVGIVRFWPNVVIPAVFAVLFGPLVGGIGAAIGIFISDTLIHHDPLLSLTVGVTSNFVGFYLLGLIARKNIEWKKTLAMLGAILSLSLIVLGYALYVFISLNATILFIGLVIATYLITMVAGQKWPEWRSYGIASLVGLGVGSTIIGVGVWTYSQLFILPEAVGGGFQLPPWTILIFLIWTFATEIPFLITLGPPILKTCYKAFPGLKPMKERGK
ncbi:MAG: ECF transporter S component [Candidatus Bathyarchaeia archaeon]